MKLSTDKCSKIINSLNTLSVAGKITDGNKRGPLIFASDAIFTFSTRFVTRVKIVIFTRQDWKLSRSSYPACINYHHSNAK